MQPSKDRSPPRQLLMRRKRPKSEPESRPAALDVAGFDRLEASLNELSKAAATQSLTYLLLWLYLAFTVASVTDYDLLIENPIKLPIFNLEIGLIAFFVAAPPLFWLVQLYMVRKLAVIGEAVNEYLAAAKQQAESAGADSRAVLERLRHRADGFVITRLLARFDDIVLPDGERDPPSSDLAAALTVLAAGATLILAPLLLYFGFQIRFLAYQSEWITWWHRAWVLFGLMLCAAAGRTAKLSWGESFAALSTLRRHVFRLGGARWLPEWAGLRKWLTAVKPISLGVFLSFFVLTFPGEFMSDGVVIENRPVGGWLAELVGVPRTLTPQAPFDREAVAKALASGEKTGGLDQAGPPPIDLRHRDFSGRSLIGIDLAGAWLQGAKFHSAQLNAANLNFAQLQNSNLFHAQLYGSFLYRAQLQGAELFGTELQGSYAVSIQLKGAMLWNAKLQGVDLRWAQLKGAYLGDTQLQCADLEHAQLQAAFLRGTAWWRADVENTRFDGVTFRQVPEGDTKPDSPEKYRHQAQQWMKYVKHNDSIFCFTADGDSNKDVQKLGDIHHILADHSAKSNPRWRADYLADMACRYKYGRSILSFAIIRSVIVDDVSAAALSERLKDAERCPAAQGLSMDDWERLTEYVEREKAAASRQ